MSVFSPMIDALFAGPLAFDATYTPSSGPPAGVRVMARSPDMALPIFKADSVAAGLRLDVRKSQIPEPEEGAALVLADGRGGTIRSWESDSEGLLWHLDMNPD